MKKLLIGLFAFGSVLSFANTKMNGPIDPNLYLAEVNQNKSYYETIEEMYQKGEKPNLSKINGVFWPGRCFFQKYPYKPFNAAFHLKRKRNTAHGPLGGVVYEAVSVMDPSKPPHYFDSKDVSVLKSNTYYEVGTEGPSLSIRYEEVYQTEIKVFEEYLVERVSAKENGQYRIGLMCYYFRLGQSMSL